MACLGKVDWNAIGKGAQYQFGILLANTLIVCIKKIKDLMEKQKLGDLARDLQNPPADDADPATHENYRRFADRALSWIKTHDANKHRELVQTFKQYVERTVPERESFGNGRYRHQYSAPHVNIFTAIKAGVKAGLRMRDDPSLAQDFKAARSLDEKGKMAFEASFRKDYNFRDKSPR